MIALQTDLIWEKFKAIGAKDPFYIFRGLKILVRPHQTAVDLYIHDMGNGYLKRHWETKKIQESFRKQLTVKIISRADRSLLEQYLVFAKSLKLTRDLVTTNLDKDSFIFLAMRNGEIIAANTVAFSEFPLRGGFDLKLLLKNNQVYSAHIFVAEKYRNIGVASFLKDHIIQHCLRRGYRYMILAIFPSNHQAQGLASKFGFQKYATLKVIEQFFTKRHRIAKTGHYNDQTIALNIFGREVVEV